MGMPPRQCPGSISGHFHPTETITDTLSSVLMYLDEVLLHASQGRRLDSDYVVTLSDKAAMILQEANWQIYASSIISLMINARLVME